MSYRATGIQALFPVYLPRMARDDVPRDEHDAAVAQNETNLNQNLEALYQKVCELESALAGTAQTE